MHFTKIYVLIDPRDYKIRYVGKTSQPLCNRLAGHMKADTKMHCARWIRNLKNQGLRPRIHLVDLVEGENAWPEREQYWIKFFRDAGCKLTNISLGGDGHNGFHTTPETRARLSASRRGKKRSPEFSNKLSVIFKGRTISEETRAKISAKLKGRKIPPDIVEKAAAARRGKPRARLPQEVVDRIAAQNRGRKRSDEFKAKISAAHKGRIITSEHRKKLSEAAKRRWQKVKT